MGKPDQGSAAAEGDRRRHRARPWRPIVSGTEARGGAASVARGGSRVGGAGGDGITAARASQWRDRFLAAGQASLKSRAPDARNEDDRRLQAKIGELLMENEISYRPLRGRYEEGPSKGPSISQVPVSPVSSRLLPASGCNRG